MWNFKSCINPYLYSWFHYPLWRAVKLWSPIHFGLHAVISIIFLPPFCLLLTATSRATALLHLSLIWVYSTYSSATLQLGNTMSRCRSTLQQIMMGSLGNSGVVWTARISICHSYGLLPTSSTVMGDRMWWRLYAAGSFLSQFTDSITNLSQQLNLVWCLCRMFSTGKFWPTTASGRGVERDGSTVSFNCHSTSVRVKSSCRLEGTWRQVVLPGRIALGKEGRCCWGEGLPKQVKLGLTGQEEPTK